MELSSHALFYFLKDFFNVDHFKICIEFVTVLFLLFMFWFVSHKACRSLAPQPGMEPTPSVLEDEVSTIGPPGKSLVLSLNGPVLWVLPHLLTPLFSVLSVIYALFYNCYQW